MLEMGSRKMSRSYSLCPKYGFTVTIVVIRTTEYRLFDIVEDLLIGTICKAQIKILWGGGLICIKPLLK